MDAQQAQSPGSSSPSPADAIKAAMNTAQKVVKVDTQIGQNAAIKPAPLSISSTDSLDTDSLGTEAKPSKYWICKASLFGFNMHTKEGKEIIFSAFQHVTSDLNIAKYLFKCIKDKVPNLLSLKEISEAELDPLFEVRQKIIADYLKEQEDKLKNGIGDAAQKPAGIATSNDIGNKGPGDAAITAAKALAVSKVQS